MSDALKWARERGLNHEQDLMAETLRTACRANVYRSVQTALLIGIFLVLVIK